LAIAIALTITLVGAGNWSIDKAIASLPFWKRGWGGQAK
jgi:hypothetical protein